MRSLREKLKAVSSKPQVRDVLAPKRLDDQFFTREYRVPISELRGIERTTLEDICACDPHFTGSRWDISKLLFLDTETTGLSGGAGTLAFEIGVGYIQGHYMVIRQYVMRDYSEEAAMLHDLANLIGGFDTLVTFNGKTFDIPLLESRMIMQRIRPMLSELPHFDLLHACRRVYKLRLKRCNLATLEEAVLGQGRKEDLPGALVPQRYFDYLKTKEFALLDDVLDHNRQDVQSLASLTGHLCSVFRSPQQLAYAEDIFSVGRTLERGGDVYRARKCYRILGHSSMSSKAHMHLAASFKRERNWEEAVSSWNDMIARAEGGVLPYIEAAKYYEHVMRDIPRALSYANAALAYELNMTLLRDEGQNETLSALHKRIDRLKKKQNKTVSCRSQEDGI